MSLSLLALGILVFLFFGYNTYGRFISKQFSLNNKASTPAWEVNDGVDFVPTKKFYLLGQHFSAIAAAGPIAGPILAAQQFGWLPCVLWICLGVIFIGSVHDFASLVASIRHKAGSIAEIMKQNIGHQAWIAIMIFIWLSLVYVIVAFADITAGSFVGKGEEFEGLDVAFNRGGAVAMASALYLTLSIIMGVVQKKINPPLWLLTIIFVPATLAVVFLSTKISTILVFDHQTWVFNIMVYCLVASLLPVWLLLQPRGYLGGFVLYMALFVGVVGIFLGGFEIKQAAFKTWDAPGMTGSLFPFLFVTIACGACSGFHGLVCSGTTSKQVAKEGDCKSIAYGAMLMEGFVAIIALATVLILSDDQIKGSPGAIYGAGMGKFLSLIIGEKNYLFAATFGAMAFSTFVFDTLDVATRLGRYILQEIVGSKSWFVAALATVLTVGVPTIFLSLGGGWSSYWVLFGTSNQLLAGLTLMVVSVWLKKSGKPYWFTLVPMIFVMGITFWSLIKQMILAYQKYFFEGVADFPVMANGVMGLVLSALALYLMVLAGKSLRKVSVG